MWKMGPAPRQKNHDTSMDGLAIVIRGNKATKNVSTGDLVLVENSTISGVSDGGYKALSSVSAGTAFTSANLSALSKGAVNALSDQLELIGKTTDDVYVPRIYRMTMTANGGTHKVRLKANHMIFILLGFIGSSGCTCLLIRSFNNNIDKKVNLLDGGNYTGTLLSFSVSNGEVTITNNATQPSHFTVIVGGAVI